MNTTSDFHQAKSKLEDALIDFLKATQKDDRDLTDELNECLYNSCKVARGKMFEVEEI